MSNFLTARAKLKKAMNRKKRRRIDPTPAMVKFLRANEGGHYEVAHAAQWQTKFKAVRLGYLTGSIESRITPAGEAYLARYEARVAKEKSATPLDR